MALDHATRPLLHTQDTSVPTATQRTPWAPTKDDEDDGGGRGRGGGKGKAEQTNTSETRRDCR